MEDSSTKKRMYRERERERERIRYTNFKPSRSSNYTITIPVNLFEEDISSLII
jgi:hypothetical protein